MLHALGARKPRLLAFWRIQFAPSAWGRGSFLRARAADGMRERGGEEEEEEDEGEEK